MEPREGGSDVPFSFTPDNPEDLTPLFTPPQTRVPTPIPGPVTETTYTSSYDSKVYETKKASRWHIIVIGGNRNNEFVVKEVQNGPSFQYIPSPTPRELAVVAVADQDESVHVFRTSALTPENEYADKLETLELEKDTISLDVFEKKRHNLEVAYQKQKSTTDALQFIEGEPIADKLPPAKYGWQMWENGRFEVVDRESDTFEGILYDAPLVIGMEKITGFDANELDAPLLIRQKLVITRTNEFPAIVQNYGTELVFTPAFGKGEWKLMVPKTQRPVLTSPKESEEESEEETETSGEETEVISQSELDRIEEELRKEREEKAKRKRQQEEEAKRKEEEKASATEPAPETPISPPPGDQPPPRQPRIPIYLDNAGELGKTPNDTEQILDNIAERLQNTFPKLQRVVFRRLSIPERIPTLTTSPVAYGKEIAGFYSDWRKNGLDAVLTDEQIGFYADKYILVVTPTLESETPNLKENLRRIKAAHTLSLFKDDRIAQATIALSTLKAIKTGAEYERSERIAELMRKFLTFFEVLKDKTFVQDLPKVVVSKQVTLTIGAKRSGSAWKPKDYSTNSTLRAAVRADEEFVYVFTDSQNNLHQVTLWISVRKPCIRCKGNYTDGENRHGACRWHSAHPQHFARQHERELRTLRDYLFDHWQQLGLKSSWPAESTFRELYDLCPNSKMFSRIKQKMDELECRDPDLIAQSRTERPLGLMDTRLGDLEELMYSSNSNSRVNSEDVRVRECSRLYSRLLTQRSVEKCLRGVDFDPRDPVTVPERLIFGEPKQAELTHWQRALENRYERDANGKAVAAPRRDQFGRTVSPHWHHGQVRVAGGLVYACCGQQEPCYTGRHSMDDVQPDLQIQDELNLTQRGSDHVLLDKTTEQLTQEVNQAYASRDSAKAQMLLDEFNRCHGGIRIPQNVKFTHAVDKAYRRYLRNPTQQNHDDFWGTVGRNGLAGRDWWYRSRLEQLEYNRNLSPLHVDSAQIDANILKLEADAAFFQQDPSLFVFQKPKKPEECRPVKRLHLPSSSYIPPTPLPSSKKTVYRPQPSPKGPPVKSPPSTTKGKQAPYLEAFETWYKFNLQKIAVRKEEYKAIERWIDDPKTESFWKTQWSGSKEALTKEMQLEKQELITFETNLGLFRETMLSSKTFGDFNQSLDENVSSVKRAIGSVNQFIKRIQNIIQNANLVYATFWFGTNDETLFYEGDKPFQPNLTLFGENELKRLSASFPNINLYFRYTGDENLSQRKGLLAIDNWQSLWEFRSSLDPKIVGLYDVSPEELQPFLDFQKANPTRFFVFEKRGDEIISYGKTEFTDAIAVKEQALFKIPLPTLLEFSPFPVFKEAVLPPPPTSTKPSASNTEPPPAPDTASPPSSPPPGMRKTRPVPKPAPKTEPSKGLSIQERSKELLNLLSKFEQLSQTNLALVRKVVDEIPTLETWSQNYKYWQYHEELNIGWEDEGGVRKSFLPYDFYSKEEFNKFLGDFRREIADLIAELNIKFAALPGLKQLVQNAVNERQIVNAKESFDISVTSYFDLVKTFKNQLVVQAFPIATKYLPFLNKRIPFVIWHTSGKYQNLAKNNDAVKALISERIQALKFGLANDQSVLGDGVRVRPIISDSTYVDILSPEWDWPKEIAALKGASVVVFNFDWETSMIPVQTLLDDKLPDKNLLLSYETYGEIGAKDKVIFKIRGQRVVPSDMDERWPILKEQPAVVVLPELAKELKDSFEPATTQRKLPNGYLSSFQTALSALNKTIPPTALEISISRQKVDFSAFV